MIINYYLSYIYFSPYNYVYNFEIISLVIPKKKKWVLMQSNSYFTHVFLRDSGMNDFGCSGISNNALCYIRFILVFLTVNMAG